MHKKTESRPIFKFISKNSVEKIKFLNSDFRPLSGVLLDLNDDPATSPSEMYLYIL
ncbi:hypothetical protein BB561_004913 [Smittium simulii]|uniref:Uncharacterized protein n=1 Tax=Smittium simulii TaxID=133385 RepID=A0A2T9YDA9_9FUNG|nr:hypothetical protein BB561_004913 [Smittium simulii]